MRGPSLVSNFSITSTNLTIKPTGVQIRTFEIRNASMSRYCMTSYYVTARLICPSTQSFLFSPPPSVIYLPIITTFWSPFSALAGVWLVLVLCKHDG